MDMEDTEGRDGPGSARPYWLPDMAWEDSPAGMQAAMEGVLAPAYEELVMGAPDAMERLAGVTAVHLAHLEIIDQTQLALEALTANPDDRRKAVDSHLRLVGAKIRTLALVQRLREARGRSDPAGSVPPT